MEMNHNVIINFDQKTKTMQADKALELFNKMKARLLDTRSKSYTAEYQKAYIDEKVQGIDNIISGIQDGYKSIYEDNRHRTYDKPMYNNTNITKKKEYIVVCDKADKIINGASNLTELERFDNYDEALELASKIAIKDYAINKEYGTVVAIIDTNTNNVNIIRAEEKTTSTMDTRENYENSINCEEPTNLSNESVNLDDDNDDIDKVIEEDMKNFERRMSMTEKEYWDYHKSTGYMFYPFANPATVKAAREKEESLFIYGNIIVTDDIKNRYHVINFDNSRDALIHAAAMLSLQLGLISEDEMGHTPWLRKRLGIKDKDLLECKKSLLKHGYYRLNSLYIVDADRISEGKLK